MPSELFQPPSSQDLTVWCDFCGGKATPPFDFSKNVNPKVGLKGKLSVCISHQLPKAIYYLKTRAENFPNQT